MFEIKHRSLRIFEISIINDIGRPCELCSKNFCAYLPDSTMEHMYICGAVQKRPELMLELAEFLKNMENKHVHS